jgi:hypothetical protein
MKALAEVHYRQQTMRNQQLTFMSHEHLNPAADVRF